MAIDTSKIDLMAGLDEVVMNQRVRGYVPGAIGLGTNLGQFGTLWLQGTGIPVNLATTTPQTITAAQLGSGIIVQSPGQATAWTLDTATNILAYMQANSAGVQIGDIMVCDIINSNATAANTITVSAGTGGSLDTGQTAIVVGANTSRTLFIRMTAIGTSPTYFVYA